MNNSTTNKEFNFSYNWNRKLDCIAFTTIRLSSRVNVGDIVTIKLKRKVKKYAKCVSKVRLENLTKISEGIALIDTGYNKEECINIIKKMHKKVENIEKMPFYFYIFKTIKS